MVLKVLLVFKCEGEYPYCIDYTWDRIYSSWLYSCNYKIDDLPQLEVYQDDEFEYRCEIWIPVY
ncbi:GyrI-like domain-containing protein [Clostridium sp.]|uniref:GyrI-like domain-containing protein n=1 Tax=Clostridium sp. TaxID=1506 RepID=UPI003F30ECEF